jgi:hypothetical protein
LSVVLLPGWIAPRRIAVVGQVVLYAIALTMPIISPPDHGGSYGDAWWIVPPLAVVSAGTLLLGFRLARRGSASQP